MHTQQQTKTRSRLEYIDLFRAIGITLMIMGHISFGSLFDKLIHGFHVPMFFFLSGWFFSVKDKPDVFIRKRVRTILIPYLVFSLMLVTLWGIRYGYNPKTYLQLLWTNTERILVVNEFGFDVIGAFWFLTAMFFAEVIYMAVVTLIKSPMARWIACTAVALLSALLTAFTSITLPWGLNAACVGVLLMHTGRAFCEHQQDKLINRCMNLRLVHCLIGLICFGASILINGSVNMRAGRYGIFPLFYINAVGVTVVGVNFCRIMYDWIQRFRVTQLITAIGQFSIIYLCFNQTCIHLFDLTFECLSAGGLMKIILKLGCLVICLVMMKMIELLVVRTKLRVIIGR